MRMVRVFICLFIGGLLIFTACSPASDAQTTAFIASDLTILPEVMTPGDSTTIGVTVTNTWEQADTYPVVLKIDGVIAETKRVTLAGGASQNVTFVYLVRSIRVTM